MTAKTPVQRVAFTPGEFAAMFGKSQTWGYRQIYAGKVKTITQHGRILIPAAEVERVLGSAHIYDGLKSKSAATKARQSKSEVRIAWQRFIENRQSLAGRSSAKKATRGSTESRPEKQSADGDARRAALARFTGKRKPSLKSRSRS